jgi:NADPH:quinone reductase-like Zn-dependent oxidoreductase
MPPQGILVMVGGPSYDPFLGPLLGSIKAAIVAPFVSQKMGFFLADLNQADLNVVGQLAAAGKLTSVIDRRYPLSDTANALRYLEEGHARGKIVITMDSTAVASD